jgi:hypothetical protein
MMEKAAFRADCGVYLLLAVAVDSLTSTLLLAAIAAICGAAATGQERRGHCLHFR